MRLSLRSTLAASAAFLAASAVIPVKAEDGQIHVLTVQLPGGGIEQIRYTGDVQPRVVLVPAPAVTADPFAELERISAMMDRRAAAMLRQVQALLDAPPAMMPGLPPGASGYSCVSTMSGNGACVRSVRITCNGGDAAPRMVSSTSGDCGPGAAQPPSEVNTPAPAIRPAPNKIEVKATGSESARQVAWNR